MSIAEESVELRCLTAITEARARFFDAIVEHARVSADGVNDAKRQGKLVGMIPLLRSDNAYQIAQFFFLLQDLEINNIQKFTSLIDRHNSDMLELKQDARKILLHGLNVQRVTEAIFSNTQKLKLLEMIDVRVRLDQSDIAKFMAPFMGAETCRKTILCLAEAGFLVRRRGIQTFVYSTGELETTFRNHLIDISMVLGAGKAR